ncbi:unnamed protein product [Ostreobium quekettii]|uniref:Phytanoyl-CoA dioxygenase n=1 Tax=Ostreobium quekettii TaxID=121088 RepID=A0A8S1IYQ0_9CHLO|nr:unnamed protein product [Ostreobium quekettii]|eukprot:evm.model.scf_1294EXC.2 EVM.evm.TU.scf_1294EXC.2   scf_1294EXC:16800-17354(+)
MCVLRDAYLKLRGDNQGCNFHVDDTGFWPSPRDEPHGPGVNVWLALDPVGGDRGGLAVARRSHTHLYLDCREAITVGYGDTCRIHELAPEKAARLEAVKDCPHMAPGDAIILTRFCFHRGDPFVVGSEGAAGPGISRYSVRYMPGEAVVEGADFVDGKVVREDPVQLKDANPQKYPAWEGSTSF